MFNNFRDKNHKDTETAAETIIDSSSFLNKINKSKTGKIILNITNQQLNEDNFDNYIEKRN
ncbi:MAG TPA: hypothetical protein GXX36_03130 [Clostridiaceae bacterium]|nr:hypothetical protein [Clostridiaceae bacterium]